VTLEIATWSYHRWLPGKTILRKGAKVGSWTVLGEYRGKQKGIPGSMIRTYEMKCRCACGGEYWVQNGKLIAGNTLGCKECRYERAHQEHLKLGVQ